MVCLGRDAVLHCRIEVSSRVPKIISTVVPAVLVEIVNEMGVENMSQVVTCTISNMRRQLSTKCCNDILTIPSSG